MAEVTFTGKAGKLKGCKAPAERVGVWTDGLMVSTEHEPGWPAVLRLIAGKKYRVTVTVEALQEGSGT